MRKKPKKSILLRTKISPIQKTSQRTRGAVVPIKKSNTPTPIFLYVALGLLCLLSITLYLTAGIYARYISATPDDGESARVAKFSIDSDLDGFSYHVGVTVRPGQPETLILQIENNSEVSVEYFYSIVNQSNNLPLTFELVSADGDSTIGIGKTETIIITVGWQAGDAFLSPDYAGKVDLIRFDFTVAQID